MAGNTKEVRTIMYSMVGGTVVVHKFPFNAKEAYGMSKLQKFVKRGFTFDDPRLAVRTGMPEIIVTQEVDLGKPVDGNGEPEGEVAAKVEAVLSEAKSVLTEEPAKEPVPVVSIHDKKVAALVKARAAKKAQKGVIHA